MSDINMKGYPVGVAFRAFWFLLEIYSSNMISIIWQAALATEVPGPKMATTPAWYKKSSVNMGIIIEKEDKI